MNINRYSPNYTLSHNHFINLTDYSTDEIFEVLYATKAMKSKFLSNESTDILNGAAIAVLFGEYSLRMRTAIELGVKQLGGEAVNIPFSQNEIAAGENIMDITKAISAYGIRAIITRGVKQTDLENFSKYSDLSIINSTNETTAPMQAIADIYTIWEKLGRINDCKIAYIGKCTNTATSLAACAVKCGANISMAMPDSMTISREQINKIRQYGKCLVTNDVLEAIENADVVYTDGYHGELSSEDREILKPYQVNARLMSKAKPSAIFMHPLPASRGLEVTSEVCDGKQSVVYEQAGNKLHAIKALIALLVK